MVIWSDRIAKHIITIGGIGTILVVLMVVLVLLGNVLPLFRRAEILPVASVPTNTTQAPGLAVVAFGIDEYTELVWFLHANHRVTVRSPLSWNELGSFELEEPMAEGLSITSVCVDSSNRFLVIGYSDGSVRPVSLTFEVAYQRLADLETKIADEIANGPVEAQGAVYRLTAGSLVRQTRVSEVVFHESIQVFGEPVQDLDCQVRRDESGFAESTVWRWGASSSAQIAFGTLEQTPAMLGDQVESKASLWRSRLPERSASSRSKVRGVMVTAREDAIESIDASGEVTWWIAGEGEWLEPKQTYLTITGSESRPTAHAPLLGRSTWLVGGESGHVEAVSVAPTAAGQELLSVHRIFSEASPVRALASSPANRLFGTMTDSGRIHLHFATTEGRIADWLVPSEQASTSIDGSWHLQFNASGTSLAVLSPDHLWIWNVEAPFPEASWSAYFRPVWYEGYTQPQHRWQSSTGSIEGETKFGMWPLIFGTLKATLYSMLIAAPIALLAAIFGSEFMSSKWRLRFKPMIELMASVPSVVLGFIGAMVIAPFLRDRLAWVLLSGVFTLVFYLLAAHLWMLIPTQRAIPLRRYRLPLMFAVPPVAMWVSLMVSRPLEHWVFQTTMVDWLGNNDLGPWPGWFLLAIFPSGLLVWWLASGPLNAGLQYLRSGSGAAPLMRLIAFGLSCVLAILTAMLLASLLSGIGWDARGSLIGPYQERNALLVGGILGFAIIPLIYTLADDALQSVPQHLRSASLGCGATVWQTTIRVVVPTAMSGLFSALMIGFGRAIGETMVVLMAAGNTPLMDINPFNGYRTLSATLATELPEAARGSTHYHTLFLAALLLFLFTLVVNTCAEWVRLRFRKRAYQL